MEPLVLFREFALSLLLGLLVGFQRERTHSYLAGVRTFPLITVFGTLCAIFSLEFDQPWVLPVGLVGMIGVILTGNLHKFQQVDPDPGVTTEVAMLMMFLLGAFVTVGPWSLAVVLGATVAVLLHLKPLLHRVVARVGDEDFRAIMQFVVITFIILPVLPNEAYDPVDLLRPIFPELRFAEFEVLNPYEIWLMVVLVVAISLGGYLTYKFLGPQAGIVLGGILGGTISSTATAVSYSRRSVLDATLAGMSMTVIMISTTVAYLRVLLEVSVVAPQFVRVAAGPILTIFMISVVLSVATWLVYGREQTQLPVQGNPTELKSALAFAAAYAVVLLLVAVGRYYLQQEGLYVIAALSGITNIDAITLSTSRLVRGERIDPVTGWRIIVIATMSNLVFKGAIVGFLGTRPLFRRTCLVFGLSFLGGLAVLFFWPT